MTCFPIILLFPNLFCHDCLKVITCNTFLACAGHDTQIEHRGMSEAVQMMMITWLKLNAQCKSSIYMSAFIKIHGRNSINMTAFVETQGRRKNYQDYFSDLAFHNYLYPIMLGIWFCYLVT